MVSLVKSERFQTEYKSFKNRIDLVDNIALKTEVAGLLEKLLNEVKNVDIQHQDLGSIKNLASNGVDVKTKILEIRKRIDKKLTDYEKTKKLL